jgi:nickel-dependent lactate racemase
MNEQTIQQKISELIPPLVRPGERVLVIVPDTTRSGPIAMLLRHLLPVLRESGAHPRILVALGTHPPMSRDALYAHVGIDPSADSTPVMNHAWNDPGQLVSVGTLSAARIDELSQGLMNEPVDLRVNRELPEADRAIIVNAVIPHELVGFSGGSKYLFPGISGPEMIDVSVELPLRSERNK